MNASEPSTEPLSGEDPLLPVRRVGRRRQGGEALRQVLHAVHVGDDDGDQRLHGPLLGEDQPVDQVAPRRHAVLVAPAGCPTRPGAPTASRRRPAPTSGRLGHQVELAPGRVGDRREAEAEEAPVPEAAPRAHLPRRYPSSRPGWSAGAAPACRCSAARTWRRAPQCRSGWAGRRRSADRALCPATISSSAKRASPSIITGRARPPGKKGRIRLWPAPRPAPPASAAAAACAPPRRPARPGPARRGAGGHPARRLEGSRSARAPRIRACRARPRRPRLSRR